MTRSGLVLLATLLLAGASLTGSARAEELTGLDLEDLLELRLNTMGLSDIHHTHVQGEWMIGYRFMFMHMDGNRSGAHDVSRRDVLRDFPVTPTEMDMEMHMLEVMYAPTDQLTLMVMVPWVRKSMDHVTRTGRKFTTRSDGFGDVSLGGLYTLHKEGAHELIAMGMLGLPTGGINEKDDTPAGRTVLPYPMQLGSGSFGLHGGLTYLGQTDDWGWGGHLGVTQPLNRNNADYRLGTSGTLTVWGARRLSDWTSVSLRLDGRAWGDIHGSDDRLNPNLVPTADPDRRAGRRIDLLAGLNLFATEGILGGHRVTLEGGVPIYQWLDGPQLELDWRLTVGWNWVF